MSSWLVTLLYSHRGDCYPDASRRTREVAASLPPLTMRVEGPPGGEWVLIMATVLDARKNEAVERATIQAAALLDLAQLRLLGVEQ